MVRRLRSILSQPPLPTTTFRQAPDSQQRERLEAERERVKAAYRSGGLEAARTDIDQTEVLRSLRARK